MATYQILYWHDIPVQVRAKGAGRERASIQLSQRFQDAVDSAAMATKLFGSEEYLSMFQWGEEKERTGSAQYVASIVVAEMEAATPDIDWRTTVEDLRGG